MNDALWLKLGKTDPAHTKGFKRSGGFSGTALKPMWVWQRLTEEFGPCGTGWGFGEPTFQVVPTATEILVYCTVSAWHGKPENVLFGVGGDKALTVNKYGPSSDDEAFKKAFTDALMNAFKFIGVGADIHMGLFDDSKYVAEVRREFQGEAPPPVKNPTINVHPEGPDWWGAEGYGMSASAAKKEGWGETLDTWLGDIPNIPTAEKWKEWCGDNAADIKRLPKGWRIMLREAAEERGVELGAIQSTTLKAA
jgi:hypothetical protein